MAPAILGATHERREPRYEGKETISIAIPIWMRVTVAFSVSCPLSSVFRRNQSSSPPLSESLSSGPSPPCSV